MSIAPSQVRLFQPVLCVDMDGTLLRTDTLWESLLSCLRSKPWILLLLPWWLLRGKAGLKEALAAHCDIRPEALPMNQSVLEFVRRRKEQGAAVWLVTGANMKLATSVAGHLRMFDGVIASDGGRNVVGETKLHAIRQRVGSETFDYIGDSRHDEAIWREIGSACVVGSARLIARISRDICPVVFAAETRGVSLKAIIRLMRPHQWAKNVLVFAPLLFAHKLLDFHAAYRSAVAMLAFCAVASSIYIINDLWDIEADRLHPTKCRRPLASGEVSIPLGMVMSLVLAAVAIALGLSLGVGATGMILAYFAISVVYTLYLKTKLLMDVIVLAGLYTHRILTGGLASEIPVSPWLLAFSMFVFFSLASLKRYSELRRSTEQSLEESRRGYVMADTELVRAAGVGSALMAVMVFALYVNGEMSRKMYADQSLLWMECPLLLYCLLRLWFLGNRGLIKDDPLVFALTNRVTVACAGIGVLLMVIASKV